MIDTPEGENIKVGTETESNINTLLCCKNNDLNKQIKNSHVLYKFNERRSIPSHFFTLF